MEKDAFAFLLDFYFLGKVVATETAVRRRFTDSKICRWKIFFGFFCFVLLRLWLESMVLLERGPRLFSNQQNPRRLGPAPT